MAELITVAGVAISVPAVLSASWTVLKAAYSLYGNVDLRRKQIRLLLDRCQDINIIAKLAKKIDDNPDALTTHMQNDVKDLQSTCNDVYAVVEKLKNRGFLWCIVNQDKIDIQISNVERKVAIAFQLFNFGAQLEGKKLEQELLRARESDQSELVSKLNELSQNDDRIMSALQDQGNAHQRVEELLIAVLKCVQGREPDNSPQANFLRSANNALQRRSGGRSQILQSITEDWIVTTLEVDFNSTDTIGQGSFGRVHVGQWNAVLVAVKQMYTDDARTLLNSDRKGMYKEVKLWTTFHHPNVLRLFGACLEAALPFLIMPYCPQGNLLVYLRTNADANRVDLSYDIVAGLSYLHTTRNVVHADLKGANVLVDDNKALVADFGLSQAIDDVRSRSGNTSRQGPRGTLRWMAPECLDGEPPSKASDIYSLGITIWEAYSEQVPFAQYNERVLPRRVVDKQERPVRPQRMQEDAMWSIVQHCWEADSASRPTISKVQRLLQPLTTRLGPHNFALNSRPSSSRGTRRTIYTAPATIPAQSSKSASRLEQKWAQSLHLAQPSWKRGSPSSYIDEVTIPVLPSDKQYQYRVVKGNTDLGIRSTYPREANESQRINLLEYNQGYGVQDTTPIKVFAVDPDEEEGGKEALVASWSKHN